MTRFIRALSFCLLPLLAGEPETAQAEEPNALCPASFEAPATPMRFSRELRRSLFDGKELVVRRDYRITFTPVASGYRIDGSQINTQVSVPERLAPLAELERNRPDTGMFPLMLDKAGQIVTIGQSNLNAPEKAQSLSNGLITGAGLKGLAQEQATLFVERLFSAQGPRINQWPTLLFRPGNRPMQARQEMTLPDGSKGSVTIMLMPEASGPCALMQRLERSVETVVGAQVRRTQEIWALEPLP